jgi:hypothetical protein
MLERFGQSKDMEHIALLAHTCVLALDALPDSSRVVALAKQRLALTADSAHHSWLVRILGLAYYRDGQYAQAVACIEGRPVGDQVLEHDVESWLILAMAHQKLGRPGESRALLDRADQFFRDRCGNNFAPGSTHTPAGWAWGNWLNAQQLRREAESVLGDGAAKTAAVLRAP